MVSKLIFLFIKYFMFKYIFWCIDLFNDLLVNSWSILIFNYVEEVLELLLIFKKK